MGGGFTLMGCRVTGGVGEYAIRCGVTVICFQDAQRCVWIALFPAVAHNALAWVAGDTSERILVADRRGAVDVTIGSIKASARGELAGVSR